jgi:hypothetical protein
MTQEGNKPRKPGAKFNPTRALIALVLLGLFVWWVYVIFVRWLR